MKKDPTELVLSFFVVFYGIVAVARWYFHFNPAYIPTDFNIFWVGLGGKILGLAICVFLFVDAPGNSARLFWGLETISSVLVTCFSLGLFWSLPRHGDFIGVVHFMIMFLITSLFLVGYRKVGFSLFGERIMKRIAGSG